MQESLLGRGGVQALDGEAHQHRKRMFLELAAPARVEELLACSGNEWTHAIHRWHAHERVVLYDELHPLLTRAVCRWAGVPVEDEEIPLRARQLALMFDRAGAVGPGHWSARHARNRAQAWVRRFIVDVRRGRCSPSEASAAFAIAWHRDAGGALLPPRIAAVELLNILRPTVAVSVFIVFCALALQQFPHARAALLSRDGRQLDAFVQEVRRFYPFFPAAVARVRERFEWHGYVFPRGRRVLLDLYGINHDRKLWDQPDRFRPERFLRAQPGAFDFLPQGGGNAHAHHRCPGEGITLALMKQAIEFLVHHMRYTVPPQDMTIDRSRLPALPRDRFVIQNVRLAARL
jgi:fatty-acid peroxygenase